MKTKRKNKIEKEIKNSGYAWLLARHPQRANPGNGVVSTCGIQGARHTPFHPSSSSSSSSFLLRSYPQIPLSFFFYFFFFFPLLLRQWKERQRQRQRDHKCSLYKRIYIDRGQPGQRIYLFIYIKHKCKYPVTYFLKETSSFNKNDEYQRIQHRMIYPTNHFNI